MTNHYLFFAEIFVPLCDYNEDHDFSLLFTLLDIDF